METTRILIPDKDGNLRKLLSVATCRDKKGLNLYFFFPKKFKRLVSHNTLDYQNFLEDRTSNVSVDFNEFHLRYPPDGRVHVSIKGKKDQALQKRSYFQHKPLSELTGKLLLTVIPKSLESYPIHSESLTELDWKIDGGMIPGFFHNQPIRLNFWIGSGKEDTLLDKGRGVEKYEMMDTLRYAQVFNGLDDNEKVQLFMAVARPKDLVEFPNVMSIFIHSENSPSLKRKEIS
jgi:hypothetical protein